jgi:hypothetical protein
MTARSIPSTWRLRKKLHSCPGPVTRWVLERHTDSNTYLVFGRYLSFWGALEDLALTLGYELMLRQNRNIMMGLPPDHEQQYVFYNNVLCKWSVKS